MRQTFVRRCHGGLGSPGPAGNWQIKYDGGEVRAALALPSARDRGTPEPPAALTARIVLHADPEPGAGAEILRADGTGQCGASGGVDGARSLRLSISPVVRLAAGRPQSHCRKSSICRGTMRRRSRRDPPLIHAAVVPELPGSLGRIDAGILPPGGFVPTRAERVDMRTSVGEQANFCLD